MEPVAQLVATLARQLCVRVTRTLVTSVAIHLISVFTVAHRLTALTAVILPAVRRVQTGAVGAGVLPHAVREIRLELA
jgi:hypothetical protein